MLIRYFVFFLVLLFILWNNHLQIFSAVKDLIILLWSNFEQFFTQFLFTQCSFSTFHVFMMNIKKNDLQKLSFFAILFRFETIWFKILSAFSISNIFPNLYVSFIHFIYPFYYLVEQHFPLRKIIAIFLRSTIWNSIFIHPISPFLRSKWYPWIIPFLTLTVNIKE